MQFHDAVGVNCEKGATTNSKAQVPSKWLRCLVYMLPTPPSWRETVTAIYYSDLHAFIAFTKCANLIRHDCA